MKNTIIDYLKRPTTSSLNSSSFISTVNAEVSLNDSTSDIEPKVHELNRQDMEINLAQISLKPRVKSHGNTQSIPINSIRPNPNQPRLEMEEAALMELAASIENFGLMQPITVRQTVPFEYELVAGGRRLAACKMLGMDYIPATIMRVSESDSAVLALVENIQRENLNYMEEAEAFVSVINEFGLTQEELAEKLGKTQSTVANKIRILKLSGDIRKLLLENGLTERHARALLRLPNNDIRKEVLAEVIKKGLNVAKTESLIEKRMKALNEKSAPDKIKRPSHLPHTFRDIRIFSNTIRKAVELMNKSGVNATTKRKESEEYIEYTIKIPK